LDHAVRELPRAVDVTPCAQRVCLIEEGGRRGGSRRAGFGHRTCGGRCFGIARNAAGRHRYIPGPMSRPLSRRTLLAASAGLALWPFAGRAFGDASRFVPAVARHRGRWDARDSGLRRLSWELQRRTSVDVIPEARPVALDSPQLFRSPFLYLGGDGGLPALTDAEVGNLRRFLTYGGLLLADANDGSNGSGFDADFRREMARVLPRSRLQPLSDDHV